MEPLDGLAYLGRNPGSQNVYVITGDSGNGMTHATIGGLLVSDLVIGRSNRWVDIYDPARKPIREALQYIKEQSNIAAQYADWVSGGDEEDAGAIAPGDGALLRSGFKKYAVYRDLDGGLHARSAKCTHLGCIVQWNAAEKTWDCPCHGSLYSPYGTVVHGPPVSNLTAVSEEVWRELVGGVQPSDETRGERFRKDKRE
jgi:Rieske Fe-S protein